MKTLRGVLLDVDGTLVDSNDAQAHAWVEAMSASGFQASFDQVRPLIGMGGDKVLPEVLGIEKDSEEGKQVSQRRKEIFKAQYLPSLKAFPRAEDLLQHMHEIGLKLVVATSAEPDELESLLRIVGPRTKDLIAQEASSKDAKESKPDSDVMQSALKRMGYGPEEVLMLGDTAYDIESAAKVRVGTIALRCGGWKDSDLKGAIAIYDDPADVLAHYDESPFCKRTQSGSHIV